MILLIVIAVLFILYSELIIYYWRAWDRLPLFTPGATPTSTRISVIIPARNEEDNIGHLLRALQNQTYPADLFEIIVVDDHSTDQTASIVKQFSRVKLISLKEDAINSYKKKAIETGIAAASNDFIVTTDADCIPLPGWLETIASFKEKNNPVFIAAPVSITCNNSIVETFQSIDFMVLQGITGAAVYKKSMAMCNGANLGYDKKVFHEVGGFENIDKIASGDDMLLMHKISTAHPNDVGYLKSKEAIVSTAALKTWKAFFNQRIRWASKATFYNDKRIFWVLLMVYLFNFSFLLLAVAGIFCWHYWIWLGVLWVAKTLVEYPFFISAAKFFNKTWAIKMFFFFQPLHILYTIISGLFGQFGKYEWKGRRVK
jgi:cellulose synthase/poly-beta-1,6-N-acetylglucosamine synthase-like glycosyltransferase